MTNNPLSREAIEETLKVARMAKEAIPSMGADYRYCQTALYVRGKIMAEQVRGLSELLDETERALSIYADHQFYEDENGAASARAICFVEDGVAASEALNRIKQARGE